MKWLDDYKEEIKLFGIVEWLIVGGIIFALCGTGIAILIEDYNDKQYELSKIK